MTESSPAHLDLLPTKTTSLPTILFSVLFGTSFSGKTTNLIEPARRNRRRARLNANPKLQLNRPNLHPRTFHLENRHHQLTYPNFHRLSAHRRSVPNASHYLGTPKKLPSYLKATLEFRAKTLPLLQVGQNLQLLPRRTKIKVNRWGVRQRHRVQTQSPFLTSTTALSALASLCRRL